MNGGMASCLRFQSRTATTNWEVRKVEDPISNMNVVVD